jgi:hypothetical protein
MNTKSSTDILWEASVRYSDTYGLSDEKRNELADVLRAAVIKICWDYGVHN